MMHSFVKRRPLIPLGTKIAEFPPVIRPLHCDESSEVYLLEKGKDYELLAVFLQLDDAESIDQAIGKLERWWALLPPQSLKAEHIDPYCVEERKYVRAILRVSATWGPECGSSLIESDDLGFRNTLNEAITLCEQARASILCPVFSTSLVWLRTNQDHCSLVPLIATRWSSRSEADAIRGLTRLSYFLLSGIEHVEGGVTDRPIIVSRWAKNIRPETSRLLANCLLSGDKEEGIKDFVALSSALNEESQQVQPSARTTKSAAGRGLAKVAGMHKLKSLLEHEVVSPLRDPEKFKRYGLTVPNGILLFGPPGCGKTYISKQLAEELGYFFLEIIPSEVAGSYIHQTVLKIRDVFESAAEMAPSVIFIDEFEALVPPRSELGGHQQYKSEEVNELLVQLGTCAERRIFLIAATNEPNKIDVAVRRTGRLDKLIYVGPPDEEARVEMLKMHLLNRPVSENLDISLLASSLSGYSASDIKFLVDEAARIALRQDQSPITMDLLQNAVKRVPPSVSVSDERRFQSFAERGID